ncbi:acid protease [Hyaloscypha variabilis F]|uniref:Acid protease n=1 Tax=Hyaloscypha variabilis (strain UAMH 11265 / GT02V1 / F) TaxID=1149755 RepID=A0A2J6S572_HYAVF|nr:acid protease [Hyaloscypha variabilis F]
MRALVKKLLCSLVLPALVRGNEPASIERGLEVELVERATENTTLKAPIIAEPSEYWEGDDGQWSTFAIRIGMPPTVLRVLPVTSWQETWAIWNAPVDHCNVSAGVPADCGSLRGGLFDNSSSTTWRNEQEQFLGLDADLGYMGEGQYGFDTVGLGFTNTSGPTLTHQIVSAIVSDSFWFGILGLGFQPTNFTGYGDPQPSFADTLYSNGSISSMSWSYTAGAVYRLKSVFGNLIFGGYDASRFTPNDVRFTMTSDNLRDIVVTIRSITATTGQENTTLMSTPEFAFINSSVPELWLPANVCQQFETAFNLTLDPASGLYLVDNATHDSLLNMNPNITLTLANEKTGGPTIDIVLPYASFDLQASPPFLVNKTSYYFPIRSESDDTLYTLGRTFLQETYVTTHYESRTFNVSQCVFDDTASPQVIALPATLTTSSSGSSGSSSKKLSGGAIAGIVIGALVFLLLLCGLLFFCLRRRKSEPAEAQDPSTPPIEIDPGKRIEAPGSAQASNYASEADGQEKVEIQGNPIMHPQELEAEVPGAGPSYARGVVEGRAMSPIREQKTPMAELGVEEAGLGEGHGAGYREQESPRSGDRERGVGVDNIVSPSSDTMPSVMGRGRPIRTSSPTVSESTWSPSTPVQRRGSKFEERFGD